MAPTDPHQLRLRSSVVRSLVVTQVTNAQVRGRDESGEVLVPLTAIVRIENLSRPQRAARRPFWIHLTNGDQLGVQSFQLSEERLTITIQSGQPPLELPLEYLAGVQVLDEQATWRTDDPQWRTVRRIQENNDAVLLRNGDRIVGEVIGWSDQTLTLNVGDAEQTIAWSSAVSLKMNPTLTETPPDPASGWTVLLADESRLTVANLQRTDPSDMVDRELASIEWLGHRELPIDWSTVRTLDRIAPELVPLEISPAQWLPLANDSPELGMPLIEPQRDLNAEGLPLRFVADLDPLSTSAGAITLAPRGWGLTSGGQAEWQIAPEWKELQFGCGLDATAGARGHVILRVLVDGAIVQEMELFAGEPAQWPAAIPLTGGQRLVLQIVPGPEGTAGDFVNLIAPLIVQ